MNIFHAFVYDVWPEHSCAIVTQPSYQLDPKNMFGLHTELSCGFFYFWNLLIFLQNFQKPQKVIFLRRPMWPLVFDREDLSGLRNYFFQDHLGIYPQILPLSSISMHFHAFPCISMHFHAFPCTTTFNHF